MVTCPPPPHPTITWAQNNIWPLSRTLYDTFPNEAVSIGGVLPFDIDAFKENMTTDEIYTCTVTVKAFKEDKFSFGTLPTQDAVVSTYKTLLEDLKPGWQVNAIPVRVSNIAEEPTWGDLDVLALDEVRLAVDLMASTVVSDGKVKRGAETDAVRLALRRLKVSFYFIPDGDKFEQEKWLSRIRLRQATNFVELTGVSRTAQIFKTKERLALRPHGCNQKQCADWFKVIQQQQDREGHGKDPDLDLSKHAIDAHLALYPRVSCVFELLLEFDEGGNKHVLSTVKGLQRLAGVTCTDSGGSDALMIFVTKLLLVSFARGTMPRSIKGKEFEATLHWALLVRRVAMYFRNKIREVNLPTCMEQLSEDPFAAHLTWPKGNLLRERIPADSTHVALADGDLLDEEAVSLWRALFDQRPDVMQIVTPEITKKTR